MTLSEISERCQYGLWYLAQPYTDPDEEVMEQRFIEACRVSACLFRNGVLVFSPIAHTHPIAVHGDLPKGFEFYERYDKAMIDRCSGVIVLQLPGWKDSVGVAAEIRYAKVRHRPVFGLSA